MGMPSGIGIVDLGIGFPYGSVEEKVHTYDFFRANLKDAESLREMEFPAQYMFKQVPDIVDPSVDTLPIVTTPRNIPTEIAIDITNMQPGDTIRVADIVLPAGTSTAADPDLLVVSVLMSRASAAAEGGDGGEA